MNEIQVVGSHNSYKSGIDAGVLSLIAREDAAQAEALDYRHLSLTAQLDRGLRSLELDVYYDPEGGRYATPAGLAAARDAGMPSDAPFDPEGRLSAPGFKVLHVQDIDYRSHCLTLRTCLAEIKAWSDAHPDHLPLVITMNAKDEVIDRPGFTTPLPFDSLAFDELDREIADVFPIDYVIRPDDIRGRARSLEKAVQEQGWPALGEVRGHVLFVLDESGPKLERYRNGHPSLEGRVLFANAPVGSPEAAVLIMNDPMADGERIQELVRKGYLVRTRADADTREARSGETKRRAAAFASGAQVVTTDYYVEDPRFGTGYSVSIPGGTIARCNPANSPEGCFDAYLE